MDRRHAARLVLALALTGLMVAACAASPTAKDPSDASAAIAPTAPAAVPSLAGPSTAVMHGSLVQSYGSIAQLVADSDAVVLATPVESAESQLANAPVTLTTMSVTKLISGDVPARFVLEQLGTQSASLVEGSSLPVKGRTYLLVLQRFHLVPGDSTGKWVTVGDQGLYEAANGTYSYIGAGASDGTATMPLTMTSAAMQAALGTSALP